MIGNDIMPKDKFSELERQSDNHFVRGLLDYLWGEKKLAERSLTGTSNKGNKRKKMTPSKLH